MNCEGRLLVDVGEEDVLGQCNSVAEEDAARAFYSSDEFSSLSGKFHSRFFLSC